MIINIVNEYFIWILKISFVCVVIQGQVCSRTLPPLSNFERTDQGNLYEKYTYIEEKNHWFEWKKFVILNKKLFNVAPSNKLIVSIKYTYILLLIQIN